VAASRNSVLPPRGPRSPKGRRIFNSTVVRWHRETLDAVMSREFGRPITKSAVVSLLDGEDAWERALNAA
jgi:hypothetical protein